MSLRIGLIGKGRWGTKIEQTLARVGGVEVRVLARGELPHDINGVIVATPSSTHATVALPFIEKGIPTFIEKPMATSYEEAISLRKAAEKTVVPVFVGHIQLYNPAFQCVLSSLPSIGAVVRLEAEGLNDVPRADSSVLWDWLPHHLIMARTILGRDAEAVTVVAEKGKSSEDAAHATFSFGHVALVSHISWISSYKSRILRVIGEKGAIVFDDMAEQKVAILRDETSEYPPYDSEQPLARELRAFIETINTGIPDRAHVDEGCAVIRMIEAAITSARDEKPRAISL